MSNYWDICCKDCPEAPGLGYHCNGRPERFDEVIDAAPALAALHRAAPAALIDWDQWVWGSEQQPSGNTDWFVVHDGHRIAPKSEYGYFHDQCRKFVACGSCGSHKNCLLPPEHDGPCAP